MIHDTYIVHDVVSTTWLWFAILMRWTSTNGCNPKLSYIVSCFMYYFDIMYALNIEDWRASKLYNMEQKGKTLKPLDRQIFIKLLIEPNLLFTYFPPHKTIRVYDLNTLNRHNNNNSTLTSPLDSRLTILQHSRLDFYKYTLFFIFVNTIYCIACNMCVTQKEAKGIKKYYYYNNSLNII